MSSWTLHWPIIHWLCHFVTVPYLPNDLCLTPFGPVTKYLGLGSVKEQGVIYHNLEAGSPRSGYQRVCVQWGALFWAAGCWLLAVPHLVERAVELSGTCFRKVLNPLMRALLSYPNQLPKSHLLNHHLGR